MPTEPIAITLPAIRHFPDSVALDKAFGIGEPDTYANLWCGGWKALQLPPMIHTYAWIAKAARSKNGGPYLMRLMLLSLYSQLTLSEALTLGLDILEAAGGVERADPCALGLYGMQATYIWECRDRFYNGRGVGDPERAMEAFRRLIDSLDTRKLQELLAQEAKLRNAMRQRAAQPEEVQ